MRLQQYINESSGNTSLEEILDLLWTKCNPFLKDLLTNGTFTGFMYSGRNDKRDIIKRKVRKDRYPKDTPQVVHEVLDEIYDKEFGWKARSNSIFCTGDYNQAKEYGNVYMIFPVGKYKLLYNRNIKDLYAQYNLDQMQTRFQMWYMEKHHKDIYKEYLDDYGEGKQGHWEYWDKPHMDVIEVDASLDTRQEVKKYLSDPENAKEAGMDGNYFEENPEYELKINLGDIEWIPDVDFDDYEDDYIIYFDEQINNLLEEFLRDTIPFDDYETKYVNNAIDNGVEIMVNCKEYIGINADKYEYILKSYFIKNGYKKPHNTVIKDWYMKHNGRLPKQLNIFK